MTDMSETQQQHGTRWKDLPDGERKNGYWLAVPDRKRICWGDMDYEVVYVSRNVGLVWLWPIGEDDCEPTRNWRFLRRLDLPASAAEVMAQADQDRNRKAVDAAVDRAGQEIADESFVFPTGGDIS